MPQSETNMNAGASPKKQAQIAIAQDTATVLRQHPAVSDAAACSLSPDRNCVVAFVVPGDSYIDNVLGRKEAATSQIRKWRKTYDLTQLTKAAAASPFGFNICGWNSSYTRQPLPQEDMSEWVQTTVERVSALAPTEVLEVGCGTGLLLLRLAPACKRYVGVDFAPSVLKRVREQLAQHEELLGKVDLLERSAENFEGFAENSFSTVIVNSVAQHFPSRAYLDRVIENAVRVVRPGGHVFIGDQRNLLLLEAYAASVEAFQATPDVNVTELRNRIDTRIQQEQQLVLSPSYFLSLQRRLPKISRVEIYPRRGHRDNEMTRFRFDAVLWTGPQSGPSFEIPFLDAPAQGWNLANIRSQLATWKPDRIGFARIPNSRLAQDIHFLAQLASTSPQQVFSELHANLTEDEGIHPEEVFRLATETGYRATISWASCHAEGSYDVAFIRQGSPHDCAFPQIRWPQSNRAGSVFYSNAPGQSEIREKLMLELLTYCHAKLQDAGASSIHLVDSVPRTEGGSVDFEALLSATQMSGRCS